MVGLVSLVVNTLAAIPHLARTWPAPGPHLARTWFPWRPATHAGTTRSPTIPA